MSHTSLLSENTEIGVYGYNVVENLSKKDPMLKAKFQEVFEFRNGKFLLFDFEQLQLESLNDAFVEVEQINKSTDELEEIKQNIFKD